MVAVCDDFQHRALCGVMQFAILPSLEAQIAYCTGKPREEIEACSVQNDWVDMQIDINSPSSGCNASVLQHSSYSLQLADFTLP